MRFDPDWSNWIMKAKNLLLDKIKGRTCPLHDLDDGRPLRLLISLLEDNSLGSIQPPRYGFPSRQSFLEAGVGWLPMEYHWVLAILISDVAHWVWEHQDPQGEGVGAIERIADLPIRVPIPFFQDRLWSLVQRIADAEADHHLRLELLADLNDLVYCVFGCSDYEIEELESTLR
jgi:hypothetical protein